MKLLMSWEDIQADHLDVPACRVGYHTACDIMYPEVPRQATMLLFILPFFLTPLECVVGLVVGTCWYRDHCISSCQAKVCVCVCVSESLIEYARIRNSLICKLIKEKINRMTTK